MESPRAIKFLIFSASLAKDSLNSKLAKLAAAVIERNGGIVDYAEMKDFDCPSFNGEAEKTLDIPSGAIEFQKRLHANDAFIIVSPEYNSSMPGLLKNSLDWVSRFRPQPFNERHALLMSASPSMGGGNKGLWALRMPLEHLGARVFPDMFSLAVAHKMLSDHNKIGDPILAERFEQNISGFMSLVEAAKHYPCAKKMWIEFLGENADQLFNRVE